MSLIIGTSFAVGLFADRTIRQWLPSYDNCQEIVIVCEDAVTLEANSSRTAYVVTTGDGSIYVQWPSGSELTNITPEILSIFGTDGDNLSSIEKVRFGPDSNVIILTSHCVYWITPDPRFNRRHCFDCNISLSAVNEFRIIVRTSDNRLFYAERVRHFLFADLTRNNMTEIVAETSWLSASNDDNAMALHGGLFITKQAARQNISNIDSIHLSYRTILFLMSDGQVYWADRDHMFRRLIFPSQSIKIASIKTGSWCAYLLGTDGKWWHFHYAFTRIFVSSVLEEHDIENIIMLYDGAYVQYDGGKNGEIDTIGREPIGLRHRPELDDEKIVKMIPHIFTTTAESRPRILYKPKCITETGAVYEDINNKFVCVPYFDSNPLMISSNQNRIPSAATDSSAPI